LSGERYRLSGLSLYFLFYRGDEFRPKFQKIGELTGLFPNAAHLAVTATATLSSVQVLSKSLQYVNPVIIQINPDRPTLYLEIKPRLPNREKFTKYDEIIQPIAEELKLKRVNFPLTIVYKCMLRVWKPWAISINFLTMS